MNATGERSKGSLTKLVGEATQSCRLEKGRGKDAEVPPHSLLCQWIAARTCGIKNPFGMNICLCALVAQVYTLNAILTLHYLTCSFREAHKLFKICFITLCCWQWFGGKMSCFKTASMGQITLGRTFYLNCCVIYHIPINMVEMV